MEYFIVTGIVGGVGGLVGAILATLIQKLFRLKSYPSLVVAGTVGLFITVVGPYASKKYEIFAADGKAESIMSNISIYRAMKIHEPELYEAVKTKIISSILVYQPNVDPSAAGRAILSKYMADKIPYLNDQLIHDTVSLLHDQLVMLNQNYPNGCGPFLYGKGSANLGSYFTADLKAEELKVEESIIVSPRTDGLSIASTEEQEAFGLEIYSEISQLLPGISDEELMPLFEGKGDASKICLASIVFMRALKSKPNDKAASLMRGLR